jgi:nickel-dependent lactate racemase
MNIKLSYGKTGLGLILPDNLNVTVVEPKFVPGLPDPHAALGEALRTPIDSPPLRELVEPDDKVAIVFCDITRPAPSHLMIPAALAELPHVPQKNITLFNATGTHRPNTEAELCGMVGHDLVDTYRIVQNNAFDRSTLTHLGITSRGNEIWVNREFAACDKKILTGFIEPHFFAGFSGGGKMVMPGMAGQQTVLRNHGAEILKNPLATWGVTWGNPLWEEVREVALKVNPTFILHVALNRDKQVTAVFAGNFDTAHTAGCAFVKQTAMAAVPQPFDIVITTNSGYPLDLNLYQAVKGMSAAAQVVKPGGSIIIAADCWDGIPDHGLYGQLLHAASSPKELLETIFAPGFLKQDQWEAQIQAQIQLKADVYVRSDNLTDTQIRTALLKPCPLIEATVSELLKKYGPQASICVLPEGPQTIPYVKS